MNEPERERERVVDLCIDICNQYRSACIHQNTHQKRTYRHFTGAIASDDDFESDELFAFCIHIWDTIWVLVLPFASKTEFSHSSIPELNAFSKTAFDLHFQWYSKYKCYPAYSNFTENVQIPKWNTCMRISTNSTSTTLY